MERQTHDRGVTRTVRFVGSGGGGPIAIMWPEARLAYQKAIKRISGILSDHGTVVVLWPGIERQPRVTTDALDRAIAEGVGHGAAAQIHGFKVMRRTRFPQVEHEDLGSQVGEVELVLPATPQSVSRARALVREITGRYSWSESDRHDFIVAVNEVLSNAVLHGSPRGTRDVMSLRISTYPRALVAQVLDRGRWPEKSRVEDMSAGGRGLAIAQALADEATIRPMEGGTVVSLLKRGRQNSTTLGTATLAAWTSSSSRPPTAADTTAQPQR